MANDGYIKLYRKMMKWGWYTDTNAKCVFLHLLFLAQYETCFFRGIKLEIGQAVTSIREISVQTGISMQSVRTAIKHLKSTQEITQCTHGKFSVFTIQNYAEYQGDNTASNKQVTQSQHTANTEVTQTLILRNQEVKKSRKEKDIPYGISKKKYGEFDNVLLDGQEHAKLVDSLGDIGATEYIERLSAYLAQTGHRYKSHYATLLNWWRKDGQPVKRTPAPHRMKPDAGREITPDMTAREIF